MQAHSNHRRMERFVSFLLLSQAIQKEARLDHMKDLCVIGIFYYILSTIFDCFSALQQEAIVLILESTVTGHTS